MIKPINVTRSSMPPFDEYIEEIKTLWDSHWLTNMGEKHKKFETELTEYLKVPNITLFANGHLALECAIAAHHLTGEIITTPLTFASTTHAIVRNGLEPVFCDIKPDDCTIDVDKIESLITEKTSAIIPVHVYGNICDVYKIDNLAKKYNLIVIYDAAHAFGITLNGVGIANFGHTSMLSFHATKIFNTIEGGALAYNNVKLKEILNNLKNFGIKGPEVVEYVGGNAKMNEFQAAMGLCNLRHVDKDIKKRKLLVERYRSNLDGYAGIKLIKTQKNIKSNYSYFPVIFDHYKKTRDELYEELKKQNIYSRKYFYPITSSFACYKGRFNPDKTPEAKYISERVLTLPLYPDLKLKEVDRICQIILK